MRRWVMVAVLLLAAGTAGATDLCTAEGTLAEGIMAQRQSGASIQDVREFMVNLPKSEHYDRMIMEAYETPRYMTDRMIMQLREEFRNRWQVRCIKEGRGN